MDYILELYDQILFGICIAFRAALVLFISAMMTLVVYQKIICGRPL